MSSNIPQRQKGLNNSIYSLWRYWSVAVGFLAALLLVAPLVPAKVVPLIALGFSLFLTYLDRRNRSRKIPVCFRLPHVVSISLMISAAVMLVVLFMLDGEGLVEINGQPVNPDMPAIPILILAPVTLCVSGYFMFKKANQAYCRACEERSDNSIDRGVIGAIYKREAYFQNRLLFVMAVVNTIVSWSYYWVCFINIDINSADLFFFTWAPTTVYIISLIYLGGRYYTMWTFYSNNQEMRDFISRSGTTVRYIIINGDSVFLAPPEAKENALFSDDLKIDVALKILLQFRERVTDSEAARMFVDATGVLGARVRFLYESNDFSTFDNTFHYAVFVDDPRSLADALKGQWLSYAEIRQLLNDNMLSSSLTAEFHRIYTVAMAWKTYDREGRRLYDIKHYRPTFRICDIKDWDVDFNDRRWLTVAKINQDVPFFNTRKLFRKIVKGR